jgi:hypothetical protein
MTDAVLMSLRCPLSLPDLLRRGRRLQQLPRALKLSWRPNKVSGLRTASLLYWQPGIGMEDQSARWLSPG